MALWTIGQFVDAPGESSQEIRSETFKEGWKLMRRLNFCLILIIFNCGMALAAATLTLFGKIASNCGYTSTEAGIASGMFMVGGGRWLTHDRFAPGSNSSLPHNPAMFDHFCSDVWTSVSCDASSWQLARAVDHDNVLRHFHDERVAGLVVKRGGRDVSNSRRHHHGAAFQFCHIAPGFLYPTISKRPDQSGRYLCLVGLCLQRL